jgi:hypothetical protein
MFDSVDTANDCIRIATGVLSTIKINPDRMLAGLSADMLATDLAEYLVRKGAILNALSSSIVLPMLCMPLGPRCRAHDMSVLLGCFLKTICDVVYLSDHFM